MSSKNSNWKETGTADQLAFIRLNGPIPRYLSNRAVFKQVLNMVYNGDYAGHFKHSGTSKHFKVKSLVVNRIQEKFDGQNTLPCFI